MKYGLTDQQLAEILAVMKKHPTVEEAILFGSRAIGNHRVSSDVDLALKGELDALKAMTVKDELEEDSYLPFFFDVISYAGIENQNLKRHIDEKGVVFYHRQRV